MNIYFPSRIHSHFSDLSLSSTFTHKLLIFLVYISHQADKKESDAHALLKPVFQALFEEVRCMLRRTNRSLLDPDTERVDWSRC